uniref:PHD-type domain-containing protein n=1 Tax=Cucumis melo TaxID=3656 RepID=A0A9I9DPA2_CUCME
MNQTVHMRGESGTCNVCSAPCSSCMHLKRALTVSKTEEFSDETSHVNATSQYSANDADAISSIKSRVCESSLHANSETSNLLSVNSSHDSFSENADSMATIRSFDAANFSVDIDMHKKLYSAIVPEGHIATEPTIQTTSEKHQSMKGSEGHDDNISCVSGSSNANIAVVSHQNIMDNKNVSSGSASVDSLCREGSDKAVFSSKVAFSEIPASKEVHNSSKEAHTVDSCSPSDKPLSEIGSEQKPPTCVKGEPLESSLVHSDSLTREVGTAPRHGEKSVTNICNKVGDDFKVSSQILPKSEEETHVDRSEPPDGDMKIQYEDEQCENFKDLSGSSDVKEHHSQSASGSESDESDIVEHDVKVCDICGDAGREDLLAICSRCTDGAEHTYCMRERLDEVPEGDWLCEECKSAEENENQKQDVEGKSYISYKRKDEGRRPNIVSSSTQVSDTEGKKVSRDGSSIRKFGKKNLDNVDVSVAAKRQVLETNKGSTKTSSPGRSIGLSRDSSSKSLDKGKSMLSQSKCLGDQCSNDVLEMARSPSVGSRLHTLKGTLLKSNSFNTLNSKPKVKLVDEFIPQKPRGPREHTSLEVKEGSSRALGKSQSFKTPSFGRASMSEAKVKMIPSKFPHVQDPKGIKQGKDRNVLDRKNPSKVDRSWISSVTTSSAVSTSKVEQKLSSRGETNFGNNRDQKIIQSDGISSTHPKSRSSLVHMGVDNPLSPARALLTNGTCSSSVDQKINHLIPKEEPLSSSLTVERPPYNDNGRSREMTGLDEKNKESSANPLKPTVATSPKSGHCLKCKGTEHATESCIIGSPYVSDNNIISSREETCEENKLKAAIQAALLRRPEICKKRKFSDPSDEVSSSSTVSNSEIVHQDQFSFSNKLKNELSSERAYEGKTIVCSSAANFHRQPAASIPKLPVLPNLDTPVPSHLEDTDSTAIPVEKVRMKDLSGHASTNSLLLKIVIPEYEYIWQGGFELHRCGKLPDFCDGIQAHLSTCASPKVIEVASKLPHNISLKEVPRLSTWPSQFHDCGVKEDNIALYFFARDISSYERNYRGLVDHMTKNDLALKGNLDGVELLIFSSNQLPENSQRWNMLFFLWGVFRGKKANCLNALKISNIRSTEAVPLDKNLPEITATNSDDVCLAKCANGEILPCYSPKLGKASSSADQMSDTTSTECHKCESSVYQAPLNSLENSGCQVHQFETKASSVLATSMEFCQGTTTSASMKESRRLESIQGEQFEPSIQVKEIVGVNDNKKAKLDFSSTEEMPPLIKTTDDMKKTSACEKIVDRLVCEGERAVLRTAEGNSDSEGLLKRDLNTEGINCLESHHRKRRQIDILESAALVSIGANNRPRDEEVDCIVLDEENVRKKTRTGFGNSYENSCSTVGINSQSDPYISPRNDIGPTFLFQKKGSDKVCDVNVIPEDFEMAEKHFFPVGSHQQEDHHLPLPAKDEDQYHDAVPNLELALGAETKLQKKSMIPFLVDLVDDKHNHSESSEKVIDLEEEDDSTSLTLSLSLHSQRSNNPQKLFRKQNSFYPIGGM